MSYKVSFSHPGFVGKELVYIAEAIQNERISGGGKFTTACNDFLKANIGCKESIMTTSCTDALEMASLLLNITPGDEVIMPSFTFVSTANAFALRGGTPKFVDIREDTLNIDERRIEQMISPKTKAIVVVHYAGVACEMDTVLAIGKKYSIPVVEDNAHGLFGQYKGRLLGSLGELATQSFHETKNFTCGEGGALLINDEQFIERANIIKDKGTNRKQFFEGLVDKYTWMDIGSSFILSDILAAFLYAQFERFDLVQSKRQAAWTRYDRQISSVRSKLGISTPFIPTYCQQAYHMYYILCESRPHRDHILASLKSQGVNSVFHYLPLHSSPMGKRFGGKTGECPITENISDRILRLPFFTDITHDQIDFVTEALAKTASS